MRAALILTAVVLASVATLVAVPEFRAEIEKHTIGANDRSPGERPKAINIAVETATAESGTATDDVNAIGSLLSDESVQIASEIAGRLAEVVFVEGEAVSQGQTIIKLDDALALAEVADAKARFDLAKSNLDRAKALSKTGNVTEKAQDEAVSNFGIAEAAVALAKVRLEKHTIRAPFAGVVGTRQVSPGAYLAIGTPIVNIEKIDTLKADFKVPEVFLTKIAVGQSVEVMVDAIPARTFPGTIYAIDPQVDVNGRALSVRAKLPNADSLLRPGLFARILIKGQSEREVVLVPESAIVPRGGENFVFRVENGQAMETAVKLGERSNGQVEITDGLKADTMVVTAGQQKLRNGSAVEIISAGDRPPRPAARKNS